MHKVFGRGLVLLGACALLAACSGSGDTTTGDGAGAGGATAGTGGSGGTTADGGTGGGTGGAAGSATGGDGGSAGSGATGGAGGAGGTGGTATGGAGGTGGTATGGAGGTGGTATGGAGGTGGADTFWPGAYSASGSSSPSSGEHNAGKVCGNCHTGGGAPAWSFAGTVYKAGGTAGAPHVEVGVRANGVTHTTYSGTNGNFFLQPGTAIDFSVAEVRMRNANGETQMSTGAGGRWCNTCHTAADRLIEP